MCYRNWMILIYAILMILVSHAHAGTLTGEDYLRACTSTDVGDRNFCVGYTLGVADEMVMFKDVMKESGPVKFEVCIPGRTKANEAVGVVLDYIKQHPEDRKEGAWLLVTLAYRKAWPCNNDDVPLRGPLR